MKKYWFWAPCVTKARLYAIVGGLAVGTVPLSACEQGRESERDPDAEVIVESVKESAAHFVEGSRSAVNSAADAIKTIGGRSEETLEKAGATIAEHSDETVSAARDLAAEWKAKGGEVARKLGERAKDAYSGAEHKIDEWLSIKESDVESDR